MSARLPDTTAVAAVTAPVATRMATQPSPWQAFIRPTTAVSSITSFFIMRHSGS
jgi:hypothetical protein